jgi:hypothetical protein
MSSGHKELNMHLIEIFHTILRQTHAAWDWAAAVGGLFSAETVCSLTVNITVLALVLFGAVRLFAPLRVKEGTDASNTTRRN